MRKAKYEEYTNPQLHSAAAEEKKEKGKTIYLIALIVLLSVGGVYGLFAFLMKASHRDPGYYKLEAPKSDVAPLYAGDYTFAHYFDGDSIEIKNAVEACSKTYGDILLRLYKLTDAKTQYEGIKNIAYLNAHKGEAVELEKALFDILVSAHELTRYGRFSMFAGALDSAWNDIVFCDDPQEFDPLVNVDQRSRIASVVECIKNKDNFTFEIVNAENHIVRFDTSEDYNRLSKENELAETIIDLGHLRDAFVIDAVCALMEQQGYDNGYMTSRSGVTKALSKMSAEGHEYVSYGLVNGEAVQAYSVQMTPGSAYCSLRTFGLEDEAGYYTLETEAGEQLRHPNYSFESGEVCDCMLSACALSEQGSAVEVYTRAYLYISARAFGFETKWGDLAEDPDENNPRAVLVSFILKDESATVYASSALVERIKLLDEKRFAISSLNGKVLILKHE
ncbi:MAG: hypothetical protein IKZ82_09105 [Clostridia bacterium]|nr:hypothetical protein [Clostridia bacterium]